MNKVRDFAFKIIIVCLVGIMLLSGWQVLKALQRYYDARMQYNEQAKVANAVQVGSFTGELDWDALLAQNQDIKAWIYLKNSVINYPVVKGTDNEFYLRRLINKEYSIAGTLFIDSNSPGNFEGFNTVIYGHNLHDGSMFATLKEYNSQEFYEKNKQLELITPSAKYHLLVVGFEEVSSTSSAYKYAFGSDYDKQALLDFTASNNKLKNTESADVKDHLITLSTCAYDTGEERFVLVTKLVPWSDEELAAAKKEVELTAKDNESASKEDSGKAKTHSFIYYVKRGFYILKSAL